MAGAWREGVSKILVLAEQRKASLTHAYTCILVSVHSESAVTL